MYLIKSKEWYTRDYYYLYIYKDCNLSVCSYFQLSVMEHWQCEKVPLPQKQKKKKTREQRKEKLKTLKTIQRLYY